VLTQVTDSCKKVVISKKKIHIMA